jgi:hypothetical protein
MTKEFIITLYKVMYNRQLKIGSGSGSKIMSCFTTSLFIFILGLNCIVLYEIFFHTRVHLPMNKAVHFISFSIITYLVYLLIFKEYKIGSEQMNSGRYEIDERTNRRVWIVYLGNFALVMILALLRDYYFKHWL